MRTGRNRYAALLALAAGAGLLTSGPLAPAGELHEAIRRNDMAAVREVLARDGTNALSSVIGPGVTPLHLAAALDRKEMIEVLLDAGADPEVPTVSGFRPLHWAASRDAVGAAMVLLERGAKPDSAAERGITPLHWAAAKNATNVVKLLVVANAALTNTTERGLTPLHWAVMGKAAAAEYVLAYSEVSAELEREPAAPVLTEPAEPAGSEPAATEETPGSLAVPRPIYGQSLVVDIGRGEKLVFVWIEDLKLWAGKHEISNGQYRRFRPQHNSLFRDSFGLNEQGQPAVYVSWNDAQAYADWLNTHYAERLPLGCRFRLLTEEEWNFVARCGTRRKYPWGNAWPPKYGNYSDLSARRSLSEWKGVRGYDDGFPVTCPVDQGGTNEWGICGLGGNVWEWCSDWFGQDSKFKVRKGGSWDFDQRPNLEIAFRGFDRPDARYDTIGFRLAASRQTAGVRGQEPGAGPRPEPARKTSNAGR